MIRSALYLVLFLVVLFVLFVVGTVASFLGPLFGWGS